MNRYQLEKLCSILREAEVRALQENGLYSLSGGFADTVLDDFDEETVYCTIRYGVADEDGQNISTDTLEIDLADLN